MIEIFKAGIIEASTVVGITADGFDGPIRDLTGADCAVYLDGMRIRYPIAAEIGADGVVFLKDGEEMYGEVRVFACSKGTSFPDEITER